MSWLKNVMFVLIVVETSQAFKVEDMLCTEDFCTEYIKTKGCPPISEACLAQNSTHNGVYLPYPDVCSCCDYCLTNIAEGEPCSRGIAGMLPPTSICGPGLACTYNKGSSATCQPMVTGCMGAQKEWDDRRAEGTLGMTEVRPKCDDDGRWAPSHCIPGSICYCVNTNGERIFGELPFLNSWDEHQMTCGCSIIHWKAQSIVEPEYLDVILTARCNDYGHFDPLQCMMGTEGKCLCVDPITGEPKKDTLIVSVGNLTKGHPACFDPSIHNIGVYESQCEMMKRKWNEQQTTTTTLASVREDTFENPQCQPDGKYHRVQIFGAKRICVDPTGQQIENYEANVEVPAEYISCNCARTKWLLSKAKVTELPTCCSNGNFESWQCRRNECFCVDTINGDQIGVEVNIKDISTLACYNNNRPCTEYRLQSP